MPDLPVSIREGGDPSRFEQLHEGVPDWLFPVLAEWLESYFGTGSYQDAVVRELQLGLRSTVPRVKRSVCAAGVSFRFDDTMRWCRQDPVRLLDVLNWTLLNAERLFIADFDGPTNLEAQVNHLAWILDEGGSAWTVGLRADGRRELQRRLAPEATEAMANAVDASSDPDNHLANARSAAFGYSPNARDAYREAVNAVEHVACPLVLPNNSRATLGNVIPALRDAPQKWAVRFRSNPNKTPQLSPIEVVAANCELLWNSDPRHGNDPRGSVDLDEARAAVQLVRMERPAPFRRRCVGHPPSRGRSHNRKEPAMSSLHPDTIHVGLDVHKDSISAGILNPGCEGPDVERIFNDEESVRRLVARFPEPRLVRACYEAGPTGYGLQRLLVSLGVRCDVVAPSLIPKAPGDKVKTDRRDRRLARLHRAGELVAIRVPTPVEESVRDLCRTRGDMVEDLTRARNRLTKFLLRHGRVWRGGSNWTHAHEAWLAAQTFDEAALSTTYSHYRAVVLTRDAQLAAVEADLVPWFERDPFTETVHRLGAYRGVTHMGALGLHAEVCDWRRFARAAALMGFVGLVPSEYSSGGSTHRGHLTKTGNAQIRAQLIESAWQYQHRPYAGSVIAKRQQAVGPETVARAWAAQLRLCGRFRHLAARKNTKSVVAAAVARELTGFLWAEMTTA